MGCWDASVCAWLWVCVCECANGIHLLFVSHSLAWVRGTNLRAEDASVCACVCVQENTVLLCVAFVRVENASVCVWVCVCVCVSAKGIHLLFVSHSLVWVREMNLRVEDASMWVRVCACVCVPSNFRTYFRCKARQDSQMTWNASVCVWETRKYVRKLDESIHARSFLYWCKAIQILCVEKE